MGYGPGSIINLKSGNASISLVMGDLDSWCYQSTANTPVAKLQTFHDERLRKSIEAKYNIQLTRPFRLAPIEPEDFSQGFGNKANLVGAFFPHTMMCRVCRKLKLIDRWQSDEHHRERRFCTSCSAKSSNRKKEYVVPSRFVTACKNGHLDEFPYHWWLSKNGKRFLENNEIEEINPNCDHKDITLEQKKGLGLSSLILKCTECEGQTSMSGIFSTKGLHGLACTKRHPWKVDAELNRDEECSEPLRAQQRNSKTLWRGISETAIYVPPWDDVTANQLGEWWHRIIKVSSSEDRLTKINVLYDDIKEETNIKLSPEELHEKIESEIEKNDKASEDLKVDEYRALTNTTGVINHRHFQLKQEGIPSNISSFVKRVCEIKKLREVRALVGFSRLNGENVIYKKEWLPTTEVFGEGIFIEFDSNLIKDFIKNNAVALNDFNKFTIDLDALEKKYIFIHSLAHIVMKGASIEAGYSLSSIRERIYAGADQAGILIYTSAPDSEGTLGGLSRLAKSQRMQNIFKHSYRNAAQCSNDPLCSHGSLSESSDENGSVCHACMLIPETSCENFNSKLSRVMVEHFLHQMNV